MNQDSTDTSFPHLDLTDLVAGASGQPIDGRARDHLAGCRECQLEVDRWNLVADGVRGLAADELETAPKAPPARPRRTGRRVPRPLHRTLLAVGSVAAAVAVLVGVGVGVGVVHVHLNQSGGGGTTLTAVSGCAQLGQAIGTIERVDGSNVVIKKASGQLVTVTTTSATRLSASGALLGAVTDGAKVTVVGTSSSGTAAADLVIVGGNPSLGGPGVVVVQGTVTNAGAVGFTVVTPSGTRVPVTTSAATAVTVSDASLSQLQPGGSVIAVGYPGSNGTLSGVAVVQPPGWPAGAHSSVSVKSCSRHSINAEVMALISGG
jgi:anti-sigma factor RsiW